MQLKLHTSSRVYRFNSRNSDGGDETAEIRGSVDTNVMCASAMTLNPWLGLENVNHSPNQD